MRTTSFNQVIDGETYNITVPMNRVETILNRVDRFIDKKKFDKAVEAIQEFIGAVTVVQVAPIKKQNAVAAIIEEFGSQGRFVVMDKLVANGMSKATAYYHARKAGL